MTAAPRATPRRETLVGLFLRHGGNLHYFANLEPYLRRLAARPGVFLRILVPKGMAGQEEAPEYRGWTHLFDTALRVDDCDLVLTPTFLREEDRPGPRNPRTAVVQVFHGMSDKPFTYERDFRGYALCLCAGQRQVDRLLAHPHNRRISWLKVGYPKFDELGGAVPPVPAGRPTLIWCPTWRKGGISSLERVLDRPDVVQELARRCDIVVKPHPNILNPDRPFYDQTLVERLERLPGTTLVRSGNVLRAQARAHLFLGDISAAGYEWLYFARPMVFVNPRPGRLRPSEDPQALTYLWRCGPVCDDLGDLPRIVEEALADDRHATTREAVLRYSVHRPRDGRATERALAALAERGLLAATDAMGALADG